MKLRLGIPLVLFLLIASFRTAFAQGAVMTWDVGGVKREALVFAPPFSSSGKHPLIFAFHGHGGNMHGLSRRMNFQGLWMDAIVVYPQGLPTSSPKDPMGMRPGWQNEAGHVGDRDLSFVDTMLVGLKKIYPVDDASIYATGFSNGAAFSYLLWAQRSKAFAAFGICAGAMFPSTQLSDPRPAIIIAGETDQVLPFTKQQEALAAARRVDKATGSGQACGPYCTLYPSTAQAPVMAILHPGGHVFTPQDAQNIVNFLKNSR